ncbi:hypothetical protein CDAR_365531 [Caerostris darwini]|uniref:Uncharacterized protein n=1 Tax=Caerostris darwini TaxID=1538125 RepID=A0AAV4RBU1_9ARAC|nr:hypothetical protein CDAR_365531 [Caerostris darwini]
MKNCSINEGKRKSAFSGSFYEYSSRIEPGVLRCNIFPPPVKLKNKRKRLTATVEGGIGIIDRCARINGEGVTQLNCRDRNIPPTLPPPWYYS